LQHSTLAVRNESCSRQAPNIRGVLQCSTMQHNHIVSECRSSTQAPNVKRCFATQHISSAK